MSTITPKGWDSFQHYKDRKPAWIKLHRDLLDNFDFHRLPVASKALAPCLWLLASEYEGGAIPADMDLIGFRLRMSAPDVASALTPLIDAGFFIASAVLADCKRSACLEKEKEKEKEGEGERDIRAPRSSYLNATDLVNEYQVDEQVAKDYLAIRKAKRAPLTRTSLDGLIREFQKAGLTVAAGIQLCAARGWQGFKADWLANDRKTTTTGGNIHDQRKAVIDGLTGRNRGEGAIDGTAVRLD